MVKVTKIIEKSLHPEGRGPEGPSKEEKASLEVKGDNGSKGQEASPLLSKLGPYEEKKKVEKVEFSDKLGKIFGVDPSELDEKR